MMRSGSGYGRGWSKTVLTTEKMAVLAPMPSAKAAMAITLNPGVLISRRMEWRRSDSEAAHVVVYARGGAEVRKERKGFGRIINGNSRFCR